MKLLRNVASPDEISLINKYFEEEFEFPEKFKANPVFDLGEDLYPVQSWLSILAIEQTASIFMERSLRLTKDRGFVPTGAFFLSDIFWEKSGFTWVIQEFDDGIIGSIDYGKRVVYASADYIKQLSSGSTHARFDLSYLIVLVLWYQETCLKAHITVKKWELALHEITVKKNQTTNLLSVQVSRLVHALHMNKTKMNTWLNRTSNISQIANAFKVPYAEFRNRKSYMEALNLLMPNCIGEY